MARDAIPLFAHPIGASGRVRSGRPRSSRQPPHIPFEPRMRRALVAALAILAGPAGAGAQLVGLGDPVAQSDLLYFAGDAEAAFDLLVDHLESSPSDYRALWRVARAGVVRGMEEQDNRAQNAFFDPALHYARRAVELEPEGIEGLYWRGAAAGQRALNAAPGYAADLGQVTYDDAKRILAVDSLHAGAHHLLGMLNFEVMRLSRLERMIARLFLGNEAIEQASWEGAEVHLRKAVEVSPELVVYRYDLAQLYERRGRDEEAVVALEGAIRAPAVHPIDGTVKEWAVSLLDELGR